MEKMRKDCKDTSAELYFAWPTILANWGEIIFGHCILPADKTLLIPCNWLIFYPLFSPKYS